MERAGAHPPGPCGHGRNTSPRQSIGYRIIDHRSDGTRPLSACALKLRQGCTPLARHRWALAEASLDLLETVQERIDSLRCVSGTNCHHMLEGERSVALFSARQYPVRRSTQGGPWTLVSQPLRTL